MKVLLDFAAKYSESNYLCFSSLLLMCKVSNFQLGAFMLQSFEKRINSRDKIINKENKVFLKYKILEKIFILKMSTKFIKKQLPKKVLRIKMDDKNVIPHASNACYVIKISIKTSYDSYLSVFVLA